MSRRNLDSIFPFLFCGGLFYRLISPNKKEGKEKKKEARDGAGFRVLFLFLFRVYKVVFFSRQKEEEEEEDLFGVISRAFLVLDAF